jgi:hypothetical protein
MIAGVLLLQVVLVRREAVMVEVGLRRETSQLEISVGGARRTDCNFREF